MCEFEKALDYTRINTDVNGDRWIREDDASRLVEKLRTENTKLRDALGWIAADHKVSTETKQRSDYWANQFYIAMTEARKALKETGGDE